MTDRIETRDESECRREALMAYLTTHQAHVYTLLAEYRRREAREPAVIAIPQEWDDVIGAIDPDTKQRATWFGVPVVCLDVIGPTVLVESL